MMLRKGLPGLSAQIKDKLIQQALERRLRQAGEPHSAHKPLVGVSTGAFNADIPEEFYRFHLHPGYQQLRIMNDGAARLGVSSPFFKQHDGNAGATTRINGREFINFGNYNYLGTSGDATVNAAAKAAIDQYGTSVSGSRIISGERPIHRQLEVALAAAHGVEDAVTFVSGHATAVTTIGYLFGPNDLILHDALIHNCTMLGAQLSGAKRLSFPHNDWAALDTMLTEQRRHFERVLIVVEGIYSMDGDYPDLPKFIAIKQKHRAFLMVDEAHSFGVMGKNGLGIREHFHLQGSDVDIWMGTLSKALAGCGGYIAGEVALVEHLKFMAPGFLYSVGMPPPVAAASLAALQLMQRHPERVRALQSRGAYFLEKAKAAGIDTGTSTGLAVVPAITGSSLRAVRLIDALYKRGIIAQPILYPGVPEKSARLRFFMSYLHTDEQINHTIQVLAEEFDKV